MAKKKTFGGKGGDDREFCLLKDRFGGGGEMV